LNGRDYSQHVDAVALRGSNGWWITFVLEWLMLVLEDQFFLGQKKKGCKSLIRCFCILVCCILCTVDNRRKGKLRYCSYFPLLLFVPLGIVQKKFAGCEDYDRTRVLALIPS
jgi:hypothetical protein